MSLGSDYASGYALGLRKKDQELSQLNYASNIFNRGRSGGGAMGGHIRLGGGSMPTAHDLRQAAADEYIKRREQELALREREMSLKNQEINRDMVLEQDAQASRLGSLERGRAGVQEAEQRAAHYGGVYQQEKAQSHNELMQRAMRGFYMGDTQPIKEYFDVHGRPGVSIRDVERGPNGEVAVHFGEGKTAVFENAQDAIQKLLVPAAATMAMQGGAGKSKSGGGAKGGATGLKEKDFTDIRAKAFEFGHDPMATGKGTPEERARKYEDYVLGQGEPKQQWDPKFPTRTLRNKKTGEVVTVPDNKINRPYMEGKDPDTGEETRWTYRDGEVIKEPKNRKEPAKGVVTEETEAKQPTENKKGFRGVGASGSWGRGKEKTEKKKAGGVSKPQGGGKQPVTYGDLYTKAAEAVESFDPRMSDKEKAVLKDKIEKAIDPSKKGNVTITLTTDDVKKLGRQIGLKGKELGMFVPYLFERLAETPIKRS